MSSNTKGVLLALVAVAFFSMATVMAKMAVDEYHVLQILFFRQIVVFLSCLPSLLSSFPESLMTRNPGLHGVRLLGAFTALSCSIWAVAVLPLTTAVTLGFAHVFFVAILAVLFLGEVVGRYRVGAIVCGFVGVLLVMRPGVDGLIHMQSLIPVVGALGAAFAVIAVRRLAQTESTATLLVYQAVFVGVLSGIPMFWLWRQPDLYGLLFLLSMGVLATAGQWIGVNALRYAEASVIGNVRYMELVYAAILGFLVFSEIPDRYTVAGAAVIIGSSVFLLHRERQSSNRQEP